MNHLAAASPDLATAPVEIAPNTWWIGKRAPNQIFHANPYLRVFPGETGPTGKGAFHLLIDPGSNADFAVVRAKTEQVIGSLSSVGGIFINHQDPDVGSATGLLMGRFTPKAHVLCSEDTWRLVQYYNIPRERFVPMERFPNGIWFPNGEELIPVPSPFCHFVGAVMLYDPRTRVLFSGDLFGSLTERDASGLWADETDWPGLRAFHQIYMPTNQALRHAIRAIRAKAPDVEIIAPQHGRVIRGPWVREFMDRLENLPVGLDILDDRHASEDELRAWSTVLARVLDVARPHLPDAADLLLADRDLKGFLEPDGNGVFIRAMGRTTIERAVRVLADRLDPTTADHMRFEAAVAAGDLDLPTPNIELAEGDDETPTATPGRPSRITGPFGFARLDET